MSNTNLDILILAAGLGTRMKSNLAKVLHKLDGRPLINHVCETASELSPRVIYIVVGHQAEDVKAAVLNELAADKAGFALQKQQIGTGDAVNAAREFLETDDSTLLVLSGDVPMIRAETLASLVRVHAENGAACTVLSVHLKDPTGYGRVIRNSGSNFQQIVEQKDATENQRNVNEINSGIYCFDTRKLYAALSQRRQQQRSRRILPHRRAADIRVTRRNHRDPCLRRPERSRRRQRPPPARRDRKGHPPPNNRQTDARKRRFLHRPKICICQRQSIDRPRHSDQPERHHRRQNRHR